MNLLGNKQITKLLSNALINHFEYIFRDCVCVCVGIDDVYNLQIEHDNADGACAALCYVRWYLVNFINLFYSYVRLESCVRSVSLRSPQPQPIVVL